MISNKIKLHIGCGWRNFGPDWIHIDGGNYEHLDYHSITKLHFENESVDLIYASHVIEYFDRLEVINLLQEWKRVLKVNGVLRLSVPNFKSIADLYLNYNYDLEKFLGPLYGKMQMIDETIYHKTVYDFNSLTNLLNKIGFYKIEEYDWKYTDHSQFDDHSQAYIPHMDKKDGNLISLNIECKKI